jgi:16S rRNA G966 N2-methylase RsmD
MCQGCIVEKLEQKLDPDYQFTVEINAVPADSLTEYPDRCLPLSRAIDEGLVPEESPLAEVMRKYNLKNIVLARGSAISGPSPGAIKTMEQIHESKDIGTVLELFAGSGAYSKVAVDYGADRVDIVDIDAEPARGNFDDTQKVNIREIDVFDFTPDREYDLIIADPNSELAKQFIEEKVPELVKHCDYYFQNIAFVGHTYWRETITAELKPHFETFTEYNTGRIHQFLGQT